MALSMTGLIDWATFFKNFFGGHESFLWGHWYPYFGLLVTSPLGFKARVHSALFELSRGVCVMLHIPWDSPLVWHLPTSWHWWDSKLGAIMLPLTVCDQAGQTLYRLSYPGSADWATFVLMGIFFKNVGSLFFWVIFDYFWAYLYHRQALVF